jgi:phosphoribosylglycinamide formyltransferase-1
MSDGALVLGILLSGGGRTLQNLVDKIAAGDLDARVACVIGDREDAYGLVRARNAGIPAIVERDGERIYRVLRDHGVELVCLAGYLRLLPIADDFRGRVLNIHPALLPDFGGEGYYGERVHRAVLESGASESGCTVHLCDEEYDRGQILVQKRVPVMAGDTVESLAVRVFAAECEAYPEAIRQWQTNDGAKNTA